MKLTKANIARLTLPAGKSDHIFQDDEVPGFGLRVRAGGSANWVVQYRVGNRQRRVTLGRAATLDPDRARREARRVLADAGLGRDHQAERLEKRRREVLSLGAVAQLYLERTAKGRRPKTQAEYRRYLERHWKPFHDRPLDEISRAEIALRLTGIARDHGPIAANRARASLRAFYAWGMAQGYVEANPTIGTVNPAPERSRSRALCDAELAEVWRACGEDDHGRIIRLLTLTGQRREEVARMRWSELDLGRALWLLPAERTKNGLPHEVPLSDQALRVIEGLEHRPRRDLLFGRGEGGFSGWSQSKRRLDERIARNRAASAAGDGLVAADSRPLARWTLHDLRRSVVTGMNELGIHPHIVEAVVNHISGRARAGVAGVYNRATYAQEKRAALLAWGAHLEAVFGCRRAGESPVLLAPEAAEPGRRADEIETAPDGYGPVGEAAVTTGI